MKPGFRALLLLASVPILFVLSGGLPQIVINELPVDVNVMEMMDGEPDPREPKVVLGNQSRPAFFVDTGDAIPKAAAGETYAVYYDGRGTASFLCGTLTGFDAYAIQMTFEVPEACTIELSAAILEADTTIPSCPKPGAVLCSSAGTSSFSIPVAGTWQLTIPIDCECALIEAEYFWAVTIVAEDCMTGPFVATDGGPADVCENYVDGGSGYSDLTSLFPTWPGNLLIQTLAVCCEDVVGTQIRRWGEVKSDFED